MVRYYGHYSNVARGKRKKQDQDRLIPSILEPKGSSEEFRKSWARLIQKIYEVDPLTCPKCSGVNENRSIPRRLPGPHPSRSYSGGIDHFCSVRCRQGE